MRSETKIAVENRDEMGKRQVEGATDEKLKRENLAQAA